MGRAQGMAGVTLIESMVAVALIAIVAAYAVPSFVAWRQRDRVEARAASMLAALAAARIEALTRGVRVVLCRGDGEPPCDTAGSACGQAGDGAWSCGWSVMACDASSGGGTLLRRIPADRDVRVDGALADVVFTPPVGQVMGGFRRFEFSPRAAMADVEARRFSRCIRIAAGGRARMSAGPCGAQP
ncbi:GspH/FimT family pseudopilin [Burkholderia gladioli]|uniref:GspH/FimT family pseudopilin n=1 Tax=Burkholderia gladioli TaxID=28095 RepID=UPI0034DAF45C